MTLLKEITIHPFHQEARLDTTPLQKPENLFFSFFSSQTSKSHSLTLLEVHY